MPTHGTPDNEQARRATLINAIRDYLGRGLSVIPIRPRDKRPLVDWEPYAQERPRGPDWNAWWKDFARCNVAVVYAGSEVPDGQQLVCVDTDTPEAEAWVCEQSPLPATPTVKTAKGFHRYYLAPVGYEHATAGDVTPEVRAGVHYSLLPPSVHPTGAVYEWAEGLSLADIPFAPLPDWGLALMPRPQAARERSPLPRNGQQADFGDGPPLGEGQRNDGLFRRCASWRAVAVPESELRMAAHAYNRVKCTPPLPEREVDSIVSSVLRYPAGTRMSEQWAGRRQAQVEKQVAEARPERDAADEASRMEAAEGAVNDIPTPHDPEGFVPNPPRRLSEVAADIVDEFERYRTQPRMVRGLRTGFAALDNHYLGFQRQRLIVVQGPSGYGKTTFANHCIFSTALAERERGTDELTLVFMLESTKQDLISTYLGFRWGLPREVREPGSEERMTEAQAELMMRGYGEFPQLPIAVQDECKDIGEIELYIRCWAAQEPLAGIVIDHAQEIETPRGGTRHEEMNMVAARLRDLSEKVNVPIMLLSQTTYSEGNYNPQYSKALRQKATLCFVVTRGEAGDTQAEAVQSNVMRVICDKSRYGPVSPPLTLMGDMATGRLWEEREWAEMQAAARAAPGTRDGSYGGGA